ncbi:MAG: hypothetical protein LAO05_09945 [Acidobacteriia bacterium]|nr:hypothetical protein [Terriglobia bacterium]
MKTAQEGPKRPAGISDEAVKAGTGKTWPEWFAILDDAHATKLGHKGIVALLAEQERVGPWWRQMVAVAYEQERGMRQKHQTLEGFQLSVSRTVGVPADALFRAWADERARAVWLPSADLTIRRATPPRSLRITWGDGSTVDVSISARGRTRSRVVVDHKRLRDAEDVGRMKEYWAGALDALKQTLEA